MKKLLVAFVGFVLPTSAWAWIPHMQYQITPHAVQVTVMNPTPYPAFCQGYVFGQVQTGGALNSWFSSFVPPGGYSYAYVYVNYPYYFVNAWANINCQ